jgi:uncharacterized protein YkwD
VRGGGSLTLLRPQNVAAASGRFGEGAAGARRATGSGRGRLGWLLALAFSVGLCVATSPAAANDETRATTLRPLERSVLSEVNALRREYDLVPLRFSPGLTSAARRHSIEMAKRGYFGHRSSGGEGFGRRIARFYPMRGRHYWAVGENLLWSSGQLNATAAVDLWLNSPSHREIMLDPHWREVGVGAVYADSAQGVYDGRDVTIVTADFGVRR